MEIKGLVLSARKDFVIEHFGEEKWETVIKSLPKGDYLALTDIILTAKWYSFGIGERLDRAIVQILGGGKNHIFKEIGAKSAQRGLTQVHKSFITPGDPQAFMRKAGVIYKSYYDTGRREYEETGPASGILTTYDAQTFSAPDCLTVIGWYEEALNMCGAMNVRIVEEECRAEGGKVCRYRCEWDI